MKKQALLSILLLGIFLLSAVPLRIFYTNDTHGTYLPRSYTIEGKKVQLGGYIELEHVLNTARSEVKRHIYLDAGDQQTGSAFAGLKHKDAIGGAVIDVFNFLSPDAACMGNHEFDINLENTKSLIRMANYPFITTNIINKSDSSYFHLPYHIIEKDSLSIGILGLTLVELPEKVKAANVSTLDILPYKYAIDAWIEKLDKSSDLIILLTHNGFAADSLLATQLDNRIDMIIGGHTHTVLSTPVVVNGILILQSGAYLNYLGQIDIEVEQDKIVAYSNKLIPVQSRLRPASTPLSRLVDKLRSEIDHNLNKVIGSIPEDWIPDKYAETAVSRWQADALRKEYMETYKPDIAMINCGGIRRSISQGKITLKDMNEMLPFNNTITLFSCKGSDLPAFYELNLQHTKDKPHDIVQSTPMGWQNFEETDSEGNVVFQKYFSIDGVKLDPAKTYRIVSHDYLAGQWDKYLGFEPFEVYDTGDLLLDAMVKQIILQYGAQ